MCAKSLSLPGSHRLPLYASHTHTINTSGFSNLFIGVSSIIRHTIHNPHEQLNLEVKLNLIVFKLCFTLEHTLCSSHSVAICLSVEELNSKIVKSDTRINLEHGNNLDLNVYIVSLVHIISINSNKRLR